MGHGKLVREANPAVQHDEHDRRIEALERRYIGGGRFVGIVFPSNKPVIAQADAGGWFLVIPEDLGGGHLVAAHAGVYTPGGDVVLQVRNVTGSVNMLSTAITIDSGDNTSYTSATPPVIDTVNDQVSTGDIIVVDVSDDGGADGLDIILAFD